LSTPPQKSNYPNAAFSIWLFYQQDDMKISVLLAGGSRKVNSTLNVDLSYRFQDAESGFGQGGGFSFPGNNIIAGVRYSF
jgi:opacity protein-like surface antigen